MSRFNVNAVRCEALFVSALQPSDLPSAPRVREAIRLTVRNLGSRGCAARVAQEFGDHPDVAIQRMRWAREIVEQAFVERTRAGLPEIEIEAERPYAIAQSIV
jgi:hypothetical protein